MTIIKRVLLVCVCAVMSFLPLLGATADAACVPQKLYSYYDCYLPDREERPRRDSIEDYNIDELEDEIERRQSLQSKKEEDSVFVKILKFIGILALVLVVITLAGSS